MDVSPTTIEGVYFQDLGKTGQFILAIKPKIFQDRIEWANAQFEREYRMVKVSPSLSYGVEVTPDAIEIETAEGKIIHLERLVLDKYIAKVQRWVKGKPTFGSTAEMTDHYLQKVAS